MHNPLTAIIPSLLADFPEGCSEYELIKAIEKLECGFPELSEDDQLALFQKHFLIKNALFQLQTHYWQEHHLYLFISALKIEFQTVSISEATMPSISGDQAIREYYLDWNEFTSASRASVDALLADFWTRYLNQQGRCDALQRLNLDSSATPQQIKHRFRQLAAKHHPDKGGNALEFIAIQEAYEILRS